MPGRQLRIAVRMVGSAVGTRAVAVAFPLDRVGGKRWSDKWLGALSVTDNGVASIRIWRSGLAGLVVKTSWWHGGATK